VRRAPLARGGAGVAPGAVAAVLRRAHRRRDRGDRARRAARVRAPLIAVLEAMRPRQWVKNLFVLAGLLFAQKLFTPRAVLALAAFAIFCALSGAMYLLNDVADREKDRLHPRKRERPIASGRLSVPVAMVAALVLLVLALGAGVAISWAFAGVALAYAVLLTSYSVWLKHIVLVDVLAVAVGFVLRAIAGAVAIEVEIS